LTSALVGGEWSASLSSYFTLERKSPVGFGRSLDGPQLESGRYGEVKILDPTGTRTPTTRSSSPYAVAIPNALCQPLNIVLRFFSKTLYATMLFVLDFIVHYLLHVSAPIGGHPQVIRT
jgi:hypothetical protein